MLFVRCVSTAGVLACALAVALPLASASVVISTETCDCFSGVMTSSTPCTCTCTSPWLLPRCSFTASQSVLVRFWVADQNYPSDTFLAAVQLNSGNQAITFAGKFNSTALATDGSRQYAFVVLAPGSVVPSLFAAVTATTPPAWVAANYISGIELVYGSRSAAYDDGIIVYNDGGYLVVYLNAFVFVGVGLCLCVLLCCTECCCRSYNAERCKAEYEADALVAKEIKYQDELATAAAAGVAVVGAAVVDGAHVIVEKAEHAASAVVEMVNDATATHQHPVYPTEDARASPALPPHSPSTSDHPHVVPSHDTTRGP